MINDKKLLNHWLKIIIQISSRFRVYHIDHNETNIKEQTGFKKVIYYLEEVLLLLPKHPDFAVATKDNGCGLSESTLLPEILLALLPSNCTV